MLEYKKVKEHLSNTQKPLDSTEKMCTLIGWSPYVRGLSEPERYTFCLQSKGWAFTLKSTHIKQHNFSLFVIPTCQLGKKYFSSNWWLLVGH